MADKEERESVILKMMGEGEDRLETLEDGLEFGHEDGGWIAVPECVMFITDWVYIIDSDLDLATSVQQVNVLG